MTPGRHGLGPKTWALVAVVVWANVLGNFSLSLGMRRPPAGSAPPEPLQAVLSPWVGLGIGLLILWLLCRLTLLSWADLTFVLPVTSIGYVLTAAMGRLFLGEQVTWQRWAGTLLIMAGTALVGATYPRTTGPGRGPGGSG
jgi:uncharacterized membrane protein